MHLLWVVLWLTTDYHFINNNFACQDVLKNYSKGDKNGIVNTNEEKHRGVLLPVQYHIPQ